MRRFSTRTPRPRSCPIPRASRCSTRPGNGSNTRLTDRARAPGGKASRCLAAHEALEAARVVVGVAAGVLVAHSQRALELHDRRVDVTRVFVLDLLAEALSLRGGRSARCRPLHGCSP